MAATHELQIYRDCFKLLNKTNQVVSHLRRDFKRTLGEELRVLATDNVTLILEANATKDKAERLQHLGKLKKALTRLSVLFRSSMESGLIPRKTYGRVLPYLQTCKEQSSKWFNYTSSRIK